MGVPGQTEFTPIVWRNRGQPPSASLATTAAISHRPDSVLLQWLETTCRTPTDMAVDEPNRSGAFKYVYMLAPKAFWTHSP